MVFTNREVVFGLVGVTAGVLGTLGVQKGVKTFKTRAAKKKAAILAKEEPTVVAKAKNEIHENVDVVFNSSLVKLPNESDAAYEKRLDHIIAQADEAKSKVSKDAKGKADKKETA